MTDVLLENLNNSEHGSTQSLRAMGPFAAMVALEQRGLVEQ